MLEIVMKYLVAGALVLATLSGGYGYVEHKRATAASAKAEAATARAEAAEADRAALSRAIVNRDKRAKVQAAKEAKSHAELQKAVQADPVASQPVSAGIDEWLRQRFPGDASNPR